MPDTQGDTTPKREVSIDEQLAAVHTTAQCVQYAADYLDRRTSVAGVALTATEEDLLRVTNEVTAEALRYFGDSSPFDVYGLALLPEDAPLRRVLDPMQMRASNALRLTLFVGNQELTENNFRNFDTALRAMRAYALKRAELLEAASQNPFADSRRAILQAVRDEGIDVILDKAADAIAPGTTKGGFESCHQLAARTRDLLSELDNYKELQQQPPELTVSSEQPALKIEARELARRLAEIIENM